VPYRFAPGKEMYVEDWKAAHFAKHLVNKVMNRGNMITTNMVQRDPLLRLALPDGISVSQEEMLDINAREEVAEKTEEIKKEIKSKKTSKVVKEEEFEGLKTLKVNKK
jgi:hypothetical protein